MIDNTWDSFFANLSAADPQQQLFDFANNNMATATSVPKYGTTTTVTANISGPTGGIYGAIHADRTLGGVVHYTFVNGFRDFNPIEVGDSISYIGAIAGVEMWST